MGPISARMGHKLSVEQTLLADSLLTNLNAKKEWEGATRIAYKGITINDCSWPRHGPRRAQTWAPNGPIKGMDPSWAQTWPKNGPIMSPEWIHNGPAIAKHLQKAGPQMGPKVITISPKWAQISPIMGPNMAQLVDYGSQSVCRTNIDRRFA